MLYPKDIVEFIQQTPALNQRFGALMAEPTLHVVRQVPPPETAAFDAWMLTEGYLQHPAIQRYVFYLTSMLDVFQRIAQFFEKTNPASQDDKDKNPMGTSPLEMLHIARYLYYLDSYGIAGDVLECGCFRGFSSCCLSWACQFLGRTLIVADSFQGLPEVGHHGYLKGNFKGEFETVKATLQALGRLEAVEFIPGWYHESLVGFKRPLCLIWLDVDLYQSTLDVLQHTFASLEPRGVLFSHEFAESYIANHQIRPAETVDEVGKAFQTFFQQQTIPYAAKFLTGCLALILPQGLAEGSVRASHDGLLNLIAPPVVANPIDWKTVHALTTTTRFAYDTLNEHIINRGDSFQITHTTVLRLTGWAIDADAHALAGAVVVVIDEHAFSAQYGLERPDVAEALQNRAYELCGFEVRIPTLRLAKGPHTISVRIMTNDNKAYYAPPEKIRFELL